MMIGRAVALLLVFAACACSGGAGGDGNGAPGTVFGGDRPVALRVPASYDGGTPAPLLMLLHGYGVNASIQTSYLGIAPVLEAAGVLFLAPEGTVDSAGNRFWNATDACCDFYGSGVDDVGYLTGLIADVRAEYNVDPARIFVAGHSNGGFMSHRMACEDAAEIAAIFSLAGATFLDPADCVPAAPVSVLQLHGTLDESVLYDGLAEAYPGASVTVTSWAVLDGCDATLAATGAPIDLDTSVAGAETRVDAATGCPSGISAELWTMEGAGHIPAFASTFAGTLWSWFAAHSKP